MSNIFRSVLPALAWTILIQVLLCLPGSALPTGGAFDIPNLDKIIHAILFGGFVGFWCFYANKPAYSLKKRAVLFFIIFLASCLLGILLEYIQRDYIPNRSFDQADIIMDVLSAGIGYGVCNIVLLGRRQEQA